MRRFVLSAFLALSLALAACQTPTPVHLPDGGTYTPSGWVSTARTVLSILDWAIPAARLIVSGWSASAPGTTTVILRAVDIAHDTALPGFQHALDAYEHAGGDQCAVRSAADALIASLIAIADTSGAAGWGLADPIHSALGSLGGIADTLTPVCIPALADGGAVFGVSADTRIHVALGARPPGLRPFPAIHAPAH